MRKLVSSLFFLLALAVSAFAQDRSISGTVTAREDGLTLPGVSVKVKGTTIGTQTDANGKYSLAVSGENPVLVFTYIGFTIQEIRVAQNNVVNVALSTNATELGEVVVTALGVQRNRNELPYAAQQVSGEEITRSRSSNFLNSMSGKVAGLDVRQNNSMGGSTNVVIRGYKSLTGNNQALYVIDGVPVSNSIAGNTSSGTGTSGTNAGNSNSNDQIAGRGGYDYGNPVADINPDDIVSVNVLKGAAATALYGSRAANGVIIINTKKGRKNSTNVTVNSGVTWGTIDKSTFAKYQKEYGGGYAAEANSPDGYFLYEDINGDGIRDLAAQFSQDASFGAKFDPNKLVYQWNSLDPTSPLYHQATPWVGAKNDPSNSYYETSIASNQSITIDGGGDKSTFKISYTRTDDKGVLPNSKLQKNLFNVYTSYDLTKNLTAAANINFSGINGLGRFGTGYDSRNPNQQFRQWFQTNVDIKEQRAAYFRNGQNITWNWQDVTGSKPIYSDNVYWTRYENYESDSRNHYFGYGSMNWKPLEWLDILGRVSLDGFDEIQEERIAVGSADPAQYTRFNRTSREMNFDLLVNFNKDISKNISFRGLLGSNLRRMQSSSIYASTEGGLVIPKLYSLSNSLNAPQPPTERYLRQAVDGYFGSATFGLNELLFLDVAGRVDQSSTLPVNNGSYFYPSIAGSFVFSKLMENSTWLSNGKLRLNYAEVGNDAPALSLYNTYDKPTAIDGTPIFSIPHIRNNSNLKPERTRNIEAGVEAAFFNSRLGFDFSWYKSSTLDQIIPVSVSASTGYTSNFVNAGEVQNKGIELSAYGTPISLPDFSWTLNINFARNRNKVISLYNDVTNLLLLPNGLTTLGGGITVNAAVGQPYGIMRGTNYVYTNGQRTVDEEGYYLASPSNNIIGDPNPDWTGGINNAFRFKDFGLNFLIDIRKGGDVFSLDQWYGQATGLYPESAGLNELGKPKRDPVADGGGVLLPGVKADGTPNDIRVENSDGYVTPYGYINNPPRASAIYDGSYVKLRELALRYSLPQKFVAKTKAFKAIDISFVGRNLWIIHKNLPYSDPEDALSSGNIRGYQSGAYPTVKTYGFNVKLML